METTNGYNFNVLKTKFRYQKLSYGYCLGTFASKVNE